MSTRDLLLRAAELGAEHIEELCSARVAPTASHQELTDRLGGALPASGADSAEVLSELVRAVDGGLVLSGSPRFFGWVIGGSTPATVAADWLTSAWDQNAAAYACSPAAAVVEEVCGGWLKEILGLPATCSYAFVTGCQAAHMTCLAAARHRLLGDRDWDVETRGLSGAPPMRVLTGEHHHETLLRALRFLGMGSNAIEHVPLGDDGAIDTHELASALGAEPDRPTVVALQAGDLNAGTFDAFGEASDIAHAHGAWVHVDGAFGLWAITSPEHRHLLDGIDRADSWATDGHKWLNVPYDSGYAFVADPEAHAGALSMEAAYMIPANGSGREEHHWNPEWSRRARAIPTYVALRTLGQEGIGEIVARCCRLANRLVCEIGALRGAEVVATPIINQGLVRFLAADGDHDRRTEDVMARLRDEGTAWYGGTTWRGNRVMRISVCNWQTSDSDVDLTVDAVRNVIAMV